MRVNFDHLDNSIELKKGCSNIIVVENSAIYAKIAFSLTCGADKYFKIFDERYTDIPDSKVTTITNPIGFDFDSTKMKTKILNHIVSILLQQQESWQSIMTNYKRILNELEVFLLDNDAIDFDLKGEIEIKDLLKFVGMKLSQETITSAFEKIEQIVIVMNEIAEKDELLILVGCGDFLTNQEYSMLIEMVDMNSITTLLIERRKACEDAIPYHLIDEDYYYSYENVII